MFQKKSSSTVIILRTSLLVILTVHKITEICSKPAIGGRGLGRRPPLPPAPPYRYWSNQQPPQPPQPPQNYFRLDKDPFDLSDEEKNLVSSEEDFEDESNERKKKKGRRRNKHDDESKEQRKKARRNKKQQDDDYDFDPYGFDHEVEHASVPQLQTMLAGLNKVEAPGPYFSFSPINPFWTNMFKKMYCFFATSPYCIPEQDIFDNDPWFEEFRSKKSQ